MSCPFLGPSRAAEESESAVANNDRALNGAFRLFQFNSSGTNCENIFKAVFFLCNNLRGRAHLQDDDYHFTLTKEGPGFKELATDLAKAESSLRGVTSGALHSLYERIVQDRKKLDNFLAVSTGDGWTGTQLSDLAQELVSIDNDIKERDNRRKAVKKGVKEESIAQAQAMEKRAMVSMLTGLGPRRKQEVPKQSMDHGPTSTDPPVDPVNTELVSLSSCSPPTTTIVPPPTFLKPLDQNLHTPSHHPVCGSSVMQKSGSSSSGLLSNDNAVYHPSPALVRLPSPASESSDSGLQSASLADLVTYTPTSFGSKRRKRLVATDSKKVKALGIHINELMAENKRLKADSTGLRADCAELRTMYMGLKSLYDGLQDTNAQLLENLISLRWSQDQEFAKVNFAFALIQSDVRKSNGRIDAIQGAARHGSHSPTCSVAAAPLVPPVLSNQNIHGPPQTWSTLPS